MLKQELIVKIWNDDKRSDPNFIQQFADVDRRECQESLA